MLGKIEPEGAETELYDPNQINLVEEVSIKTPKEYGNGKHRIVLIDCGVKYNIIRNLLKRDTTIIRVPWDYNYSKLEYEWSVYFQRTRRSKDVRSYDKQPGGFYK